MKDLPPGFGRLYVSALNSQLIGSGEHPLHQAYELGRRALGLSIGMLDLIQLHHDALAELRLEIQIEDDPAALALAAEFLAECLSPFEMTLRGFQESNANLIKANAELITANAATAAAHDQLKAEVAERQRVEEALVHAQKLQAIGLLAGGVAHHFNNLLTVVLGNLELARRRIIDADVERLLLGARRGAEQGAEITKQLLTFSRQQMLQPQTIEPAAWLAGLAPLLTNVLRGDIVVETEVRGAPWFAHVDPGQLELAVLNLAVNARDAMPGAGVLRLAVENQAIDDNRLGLRGDYVVISVSDTGEGVPPELVSRVFDPFFTTKQGGPGAGLGLSQVHGFMHQSGGGVDLESAPGEGTTVRLYLPASEGPAVVRPPERLVETETSAAARILVVEDDVQVADMAVELLQSCGYSVKLAHRAAAALDLMTAGEPVDLIFSDIIMPGVMNGVKLAEEVKRRFPEVPVLLTTGFEDALTLADGRGLAIINKPYRREELRRRISELLAASRR
ncbi:MAG TPA: ATP-binding protein [Caulobacteraceae bacterium]|jgi:signal transduction histidine kinase|nr:ATP-binding protein [Caulobacteraceae bacterium]